MTAGWSWMGHPGIRLTALTLPRGSHCHAGHTATRVTLPRGSHCHADHTATRVTLPRGSHCHAGHTATRVTLPRGSHYHAGHTATRVHSLPYLEEASQLPQPLTDVDSSSSTERDRKPLQEDSAPFPQMPKQSVPSTFGGKRVAAKETVHDEGNATQCEDDDDERRFRRFRGVRVWRGATWRTGEVLTESIEYSVVIHWLARNEPTQPPNHLKQPQNATQCITQLPKLLRHTDHSEERRICSHIHAFGHLGKAFDRLHYGRNERKWLCGLNGGCIHSTEYGPLLLDGSLFMGSFAQRIWARTQCWDAPSPHRSQGEYHLPPQVTNSGHDIVDVDDGNDKGANEDQDYTPCISWEERGKGLRLGEYGPLMLDGLLLTGSFTKEGHCLCYTDQVTSMYHSPRKHLIHGFSNCAVVLQLAWSGHKACWIHQELGKACPHHIEREAMTRWFARVIRNPTDVEVGPGYFCGLKMERIGTKLLYGTKLSILVVKCFFNTRHVEEHQWRVVRLTDTGEGEKARNRLLEKHLTVGQLSILVKEGGSLEACSLLVSAIQLHAQIMLKKAVLPALGTSEEGNIGRVIVVMAHVIDLMVFIEDSPAKMVPRNFPVTAMLSPRYVYHTLVDTSKHP
ncbi:hypothetical protein BU17DRAFT_71795 [Hysterangium stoloniferum]|nr:hypothetical protein BU17DRAFT_71795 [Hysterangium stoloniferum]